MHLIRKWSPRWQAAVEEEEEEEDDIGEKSTGADLSSELNPLLTTTNVQFVRFIN